MSFLKNLKNLFKPSDDWFENDNSSVPKPIQKNPLDSMPIANGSNRYAPPERMAELESNPRPEEEMADWFNISGKVEKPDESDEIEEEKTIHQKMYDIATSKYNPFSVGGSESIHDFQGGSENVS